MSAPAVPPDKALRTRLEKKTPAQLFAILKKLDPRRAETIDPKNPHRLIRAIEIAKALGTVPPMSKESPYEALWVGLSVPRDVLRKKISDRLTARLKQGMVAEARRLHARGLSWKRMESFGLEYRLLARFLNKKVTREEFVAGLNRDICRYAKRQMTWFKRNKKVQWFKPSEKKKIESLTRSFLRT